MIQDDSGEVVTVDYSIDFYEEVINAFTCASDWIFFWNFSHVSSAKVIRIQDTKTFPKCYVGRNGK